LEVQVRCEEDCTDAVVVDDVGIVGVLVVFLDVVMDPRGLHLVHH
jgi:hypothetical protein